VLSLLVVILVVSV